MSVVKLSGGLGNQLFQTAFAIAIAKKTSERVGLDISAYKKLNNANHRNLEIGNFKSEYFYFCDTSTLFSKIAHRAITQKHSLIDARIVNNINTNRKRILELPYQREGDLVFDSAVNLFDDSYFVGSFISPQYWGSEKCQVLNDMRNLIRSNFPNSKNFTSRSLAIHIRRGDYLTNIKARNFHGICGEQYYLNAVQRMLDLHPSINHIHIFSDEIRFSEELQVSLGSLGVRVSLNTTIEPRRALIEMSEPDYFVGCNSTFSWWASVINENRSSIFPTKWFLDLRRVIDPEHFYLGNVEQLEMDLE
jgi:hypothetical protein